MLLAERKQARACVLGAWISSFGPILKVRVTNAKPAWKQDRCVSSCPIPPTLSSLPIYPSFLDSLFRGQIQKGRKKRKKPNTTTQNLLES
mmetsp:Transcript_32659/g.49976  ORF Transcript_32659/g.49976 Transcript_32659/m.49976 type:complete len:90 (-) Transcript_32659:227-496(-)